MCPRCPTHLAPAAQPGDAGLRHDLDGVDLVGGHVGELVAAAESPLRGEGPEGLAAAWGSVTRGPDWGGSEGAAQPGRLGQRGPSCLGHHAGTRRGLWLVQGHPAT